MPDRGVRQACWSQEEEACLVEFLLVSKSRASDAKATLFQHKIVRQIKKKRHAW